MASAIELWLAAMLTGGNAPASVQTDPTSITASNPTGTGAPITKAWPLLGGTPAAGTVYAVDSEFTGTWEGNALAFGILLGGSWIQFSPAVGATSFTSSAVVAGWLRLVIRVQSATQARFAVYGAIGSTVGSWLPGSAQVSMTQLSQTLAVSGGETVALACLFGASSAGQGLASYGSTWTTITP